MFCSIWNMAPIKSCSAVEVDESALSVVEVSPLDDAVDVASVESAEQPLLDVVVPVDTVVADVLPEPSTDRPSSDRVFSSAEIKGFVEESLLPDSALVRSLDELEDDPLVDCSS